MNTHKQYPHKKHLIVQNRMYELDIRFTKHKQNNKYIKHNIHMTNQQIHRLKTLQLHQWIITKLWFIERSCQLLFLTNHSIR